MKNWVEILSIKLEQKSLHAFKAVCPGTSHHQNKRDANLFLWRALTRQCQNPACSPELPSTSEMLTNWTDFREPQQI